MVSDKPAGKRIRCPECSAICQVSVASAQQKLPRDANVPEMRDKSIAAPAVKVPSQQFEDPHSFQVSGFDISCGPVLVLPAICVVSGDRSDIVEIKTSFMYRPEWLKIFFIVVAVLGAGILLLIYWPVYYVCRRGTYRCHVTYYLSRRIFMFKRCHRIAAVALLLGSLAVFWHGLTMNRVDITPLFVGLLLLFAAALAYHFSVSPLSAVAFDGKRLFRIQGFTQAFHDAGRAMYAATAAATQQPKKTQQEVSNVNTLSEAQRPPRPKRKPNAD